MKEHFEQLLNTENGREELGKAQKVVELVMEIQDAEVTQALSKMKNGKSPGPSDFQIEMIKVLGTEGKEWMLDLLKAIWEEEEMPRD